MQKLWVRTLAAFRLFGEREDVDAVTRSVEAGVAFKGTNLWILIFAIFIASLGLNMNSTAVIIGAMLISPLMGPIMGIGLSLGIKDLALLRKSIWNFLFAVLISLITSTIYFLVSPINDVQSELLARTSPNIYDVLIALFGGLAGILALSSRQKGNVIPGVAIATALMPPLCTAGFGLATLNMKFFLGAFYLFSINTVFIAWATYITVKLLNFPQKHFENKKKELKTERIVTAIVLITIIPSIYFAYQFNREMKFDSMAKNFLKSSTAIEGNYLFDKDVDPTERMITLVYGGRGVTKEQTDSLHMRLASSGLEDATLNIRQGFSIIEKKKMESQLSEIRNLIEHKDMIIRDLSSRIDSVENLEDLSAQILEEIRIQYPQVDMLRLSRTLKKTDSANVNVFIAFVGESKEMNEAERNRLKEFLKIRLKEPGLEIGFKE
jgi:uncharacterized hydrophobic protein (TIGR00271 family)